VGWEKVVCWSTQAAISLKRVGLKDRGKPKLLWSGGPNQRSFERSHTASSFSRFGVNCNPHPKIQSILS